MNHNFEGPKFEIKICPHCGYEINEYAWGKWCHRCNVDWRDGDGWGTTIWSARYDDWIRQDGCLIIVIEKRL